MLGFGEPPAGTTPAEVVGQAPVVTVPPESQQPGTSDSLLKTEAPTSAEVLNSRETGLCQRYVDARRVIFETDEKIATAVEHILEDGEGLMVVLEALPPQVSSREPAGWGRNRKMPDGSSMRMAGEYYRETREGRFVKPDGKEISFSLKSHGTEEKPVEPTRELGEARRDRLDADIDIQDPNDPNVWFHMSSPRNDRFFISWKDSEGKRRQSECGLNRLRDRDPRRAEVLMDSASPDPLDVAIRTLDFARGAMPKLAEAPPPAVSQPTPQAPTAV